MIDVCAVRLVGAEVGGRNKLQMRCNSPLQQQQTAVQSGVSAGCAGTSLCTR